ncbi:MAG: hypothetical protein LQ338_002029 [Usnochroma carphineum]|nr:MAG: hypothetical protein LQ338_002029 [Usnochroma carphineum]
MHMPLSVVFAAAEGRTIIRQLSATGYGGPALRRIKTPSEHLLHARQHYSILSQLPANPQPTGIPRPVVQSKVVTEAVKQERTLDKKTTKAAVMPKKAAVRKAKPTGKPKAVKPTARPALKSALKSSSSEEKTVKKVGFGDFNEVAKINENAVRSRPQPRIAMKQEPQLINAAFGLDLTKYMGT